MIAFILILSVGYLNANTTPEENILHVVANSGLLLRAEPSINAAVIEKIPYGATVEKLIDTLNSEPLHQQIEYVEGTWSLVKYEGEIGYVFDGYLSPLAIPTQHFETNSDDMDLIYNLDSWIDYHLIDEKVSKIALSKEDGVKTKIFHTDGSKTIKTKTSSYFLLETELQNIRVMDAYHLLKNMLTEDFQKATFGNKTIFIQDVDGQLNRIKINLERPIDIRKMPNGNVKIKIVSAEIGC